jgi:hypothetical protein
VVDCRVGSVGSGHYTLGPVVVEIFGGQMRVVHMSTRLRQPRNSQAHITWMGNGIQLIRKDTEIKKYIFYMERVYYVKSFHFCRRSSFN